MRTWIVFATGVSLGLALWLGAMLRHEHRESRTRRTENDQLRARLHAAEQKIKEIEEAAQVAARATAPVPIEPAAEPEDRPASPAAPPSDAFPRSFQARTFLGDKFVGMSWVITHNARRDAKTGRLSYEQSIRLPESARNAITTYVTNVVEVPAQPGQYVEQNYYIERPPSYWWNGGIVPPIPPPPNPPPSKPPPAKPLPPILPPGKPTPPPGNVYVPPGLR